MALSEVSQNKTKQDANPKPEEVGQEESHRLPGF